MAWPDSVVESVPTQHVGSVVLVETVCLCRCCCGVCKLTLRNLCLYVRILRLYIDSFERERGGGREGEKVFIDNQQVTEGRRLWEVTVECC